MIMLSFKTLKGEAHLAQCTFDLPQEIMFTQVVGIVVNIINAKLQPLHHLKIVVNNKPLCKLWIQAVQDHLCAPKLIHKDKKHLTNLRSHQKA